MDDDVHTPENPYCGDLTCWCHTDTAYHHQVIHPEITEEHVQTAYHFFEIGQLACLSEEQARGHVCLVSASRHFR